MNRSRIVVPIVALLVALLIGVYRVPDAAILLIVLAVIIIAIIKYYWFDSKGAVNGKK